MFDHAFGASQDMGLPKPPANEAIALSMPAYIPSAQFAMAARNIIAYRNLLALVLDEELYAPTHQKRLQVPIVLKSSGPTRPLPPSVNAIRSWYHTGSPWAVSFHSINLHPMAQQEDRREGVRKLENERRTAERK